MTYINKANSVNAIKYAQRSSADENGKWNFMIIPSLGTGHYALKENKLSLESSNNWSGRPTYYNSNSMFPVPMRFG